MTGLHDIVAFAGVAALLTVTPGLDTALILRTSTVGGTRAAVGTMIGILSGCLMWGLAAALGISALLTASSAAFTILRWSGAAYLVWMGLRFVRASGRPIDERAATRAVTEAASSGHFRRGLLTNLLNPMAGIFYIAMLPQFVPATVSPAPWMVLLTLIHASFGLLWFGLLIAATRPLARMLGRPGVAAMMDRATGLVFIGFGMTLAFERR